MKGVAQWGEARSFLSNYLTPSLGKGCDVNGKFGGGGALIVAPLASFSALVGQLGGVTNSGLKFCSP